MWAPGGVGAAPASNEVPTGGQVTAGSASISQSGAAMTVNQQSQKAIINWQTFNIGSQASVNFQQPNSSAIALNRVLSASPSEIMGRLSANGQVFVINPSGITFAPGAQVDVGGLVASTLNIKDSDFLAGNYTFTRDGSTGAVVNQGTLTAKSGGYIGLLAPEVRNEGVVSAKLGTVVLAAGEKVTMTFADSGSVSVQVDPAAVRTLIENRNLIAAPDGRVLMSAKAATVLLGGTINNGGIVEADSLTSNGGTVTLEASGAITNSGAITASGGQAAGATGDGGSIKLVSLDTTTVSGSLTARGGSAGGNGGTIETSGAVVNISGAKVDTSAPNGKTGIWLLDPFDLTVTDGGSSTITPSGGTYTSGSGGSTVSNTDVDNALATTNVTLQTGGTAGDGAGNGDIFVNGAIAWSSGNTLTLNAFRNIAVNADVTHSGTGGALALNPNGGGGGGRLSVADGHSVTLNGDASLSISGTPYTLITSAAGLQAITSDLTGHYAIANNLDMTGFGFTPIGNPSTPFSGALEGLGHYVSNLTINQPTGTFVAMFGDTVGSLNDIRLANASITGTSYVGALAGVNSGFIGNSSVSGTITAAGTFGSNIGGLVGCNCEPLGSNGGTPGTMDTTYSLATVNSLGSGNMSIGGLAGANQGVIANSFGFTTVNGGSGSRDIGGLVGNNGSTRFAIAPSTLTNSFAIATVNAGTGSIDVGGLSGTNVGVINGGSYARGTVTAGDSSQFVGGLVGQNRTALQGFGGVIDGAAAVGTVIAGSAAQQVGGLIGYNSGTITTSYTNVTLTAGDGSAIVGGLVGTNAGFTGSPGIIDHSYSLSTVNTGSGVSEVGGLVGENQGTITNSFFSFNGLGVVNAGANNGDVGGLVGNNTVTGVIDHSPVFGPVNVVYGGSIGGVAGINSGIIRNGTYWNGGAITVASSASGLGGLVGGNSGLIDGGIAVGSITIGQPVVQGNLIFTSSEIGGLAGANFGTIQNSYTNINIQIPAQAGADRVQYVGGLAGTNGDSSTSAVITNSYALGTITMSLGDSVGGLVGWNQRFFSGFNGNPDILPGTITHSFSQMTIRGASNGVGGLVGVNEGTLDSSNTFGGQVIAGDHAFNIGGLVGLNNALISNSYNTATVQAGSAANSVGGLVGNNQQTITGSYSTTSVTAGDGSMFVGGLVGSSSGAIMSSYVNSGGTVSAGNSSSYVGGLVGAAINNNGGTVIGSSSSNIAVQSGSSSSNVGGLAGFAGGPVSQTSASGTVTSGDSSSNVGGLIGQFGGSLSDSNASGNVTVGSNSNAIGSLIGSLGTGSTITNSFGTGTVTAGPGSSGVGGQIGAQQ